MAYSGAFRRETGQRGPNAGHPAPPKPGTQAARRGPDKMAGALNALLRKIEDIDVETDDLLMALILYLMYRESGDKDLLIMLGAMLLT